MTAKRSSEAWSWRHAVICSELPATTRHVLLTLSCCMDERGQSCFPSVDELVKMTALSKRSVITHLGKACAAGWLTRQLHGYRGQRWRRLEYEPRWPDREAAVPEEQSENNNLEAGERVAPALLDEVVNLVPEGGEPRAPKAVKDVHRDKDSSTDSSITSPRSRERDSDSTTARTTVRESQPSSAREKFRAKWRPVAPDLSAATEAFDGPLADAYEQSAQGGKGAMGNRAKGIEALATLKPEDLELAVEAAPRWLRAVKAAHKHALTVENYVSAETWLTYPRPYGSAGPLLPVKPRSEEWCALFWALVAVGNRPATGRARAMLREAAFDQNFYVRPEELPTAEDRAALMKIERDGEEFVAWRRYLTWRGVHDGESQGLSLSLKSEAFGQWLWVPSRWPPAERVGMELPSEGAAA